MCEVGDNVYWLGGVGAQKSAVVGAEMAFISSLRGRFLVPAGFCFVMSPDLRWDDSVRLEVVLNRALADFPGRDTGSGLGLRVRASVEVRQHRPDVHLPRAPSFHNVGEGALVEAAMESAAPFLSPRRWGAAGSAGVPPRVVVAVQRFVPPQAWISASFDPDGIDQAVVLCAGWGLKEDDEVADVLVIDGATREVIGKHVADKRRMTVGAQGGGVREVEVQAELREVPCLDDRMAREIANRVIELVGEVRSPVRLELELTGGQLHLLGVPSLNAARGR
ncbi:PEP/pyruvate-binding domain-containing protein [Nonomuraea glycinis]|uniref:PEP/pyruvate-binding domain-containing protein n=1 Tax=Nonomuraea glycinis TaxID=2047744 RepID=UPI0033B0D4BD